MSYESSVTAQIFWEWGIGFAVTLRQVTHRACRDAQGGDVSRTGIGFP